MVGYSVKIPLTRTFILYMYNDFQELFVACMGKRDDGWLVYNTEVLTDLDHDGELKTINWCNNDIIIPLEFYHDMPTEIIAQNIFSNLTNNDYIYNLYKSERDIIADLVCLKDDYQISVEQGMEGDIILDKARRKRISLMNLQYSEGGYNLDV